MRIKQLKLKTPDDHEGVIIKHAKLGEYGHFAIVDAGEGLLGITPKQALEISRWFAEYAKLLKKEINNV